MQSVLSSFKYSEYCNVFVFLRNLICHSCVYTYVMLPNQDVNTSESDSLAL